MHAAGDADHYGNTEFREHPGQLGIDALGKVFFDEYGASKIGLLDPHANTISERSVPHAPSGTSPARVRWNAWQSPPTGTSRLV